jgi:hypothetical protein
MEKFRKAAKDTQNQLGRIRPPAQPPPSEVQMAPAFATLEVNDDNL